MLLDLASAVAVSAHSPCQPSAPPPFVASVIHAGQNGALLACCARRGIVAEAAYDAREWELLSGRQKEEMTHFLHYPQTRPDFISWNAADLPHAIPFLARAAMGCPVTAWTVRSRALHTAIAPWVDQIVFEGFAPA